MERDVKEVLLSEQQIQDRIAELGKILQEVKQRDHQDSTRPIAPLKQAKDAILVDTSALDIEGVIARIKEIIGEKTKV